MKTKAIYFALISIFTTMMILSCEKENENLSSVNGGNKSHNSGQNCMSCHKQGGSGEGIFLVAGTVYDNARSSTYPNASVKLYTGPNGTGTLKYTIEGDAKGNFYTTGSIDFGTGLYVSVKGNLAANNMSSQISSGACNSCHGVSTLKIWVN